MTARSDSIWTLPAIAAIAAAIGWVAPFDVFYTAATGGSPVARAVVIALVAVAGGLASRLAGLRLDAIGGGAPWRVGLVWAMLVAAWVAVLDCFVFRAHLDSGYVAFLRAPLQVRLFYFMLRAFNENVIYRLFVFGGLMAALRRWRPRAGTATVLAAATLAQAINIGANVVLRSGQAITPSVLAYDALRYVVPGVTWGWLYTRRGFATVEVGSVGCHVFLQPAFSLLLDR